MAKNVKLRKGANQGPYLRDTATGWEENEPVGRGKRPRASRIMNMG